MENTILILEDEESINRGISFSLQKEGYEVISTDTIAKAEQYFWDKKPQLFICDVNLPDGNGLDLIKKIRGESNMHIICLTALGQELDQVMGYEAGADDYIVKPFSLSVLMLKVAAVFRRKAETEEDILSSGDIQFYRKEMRILKSGREISLTKNEWKLLQMFLENPKQILSRGQLQQNLFDIDENFVDDNTIAVNIRRLREKIEKDTSKPEYIKNIRGLGYVWTKECSLF
ncbi:MAG: response regulator transcription factor [Lachnospiraceae bacterium]|nr:response regulator transcription factor [Lachnospiraceae bacterium]